MSDELTDEERTEVFRSIIEPEDDCSHNLVPLFEAVAKIKADARRAALKETADKWQNGEWTMLTPIISDKSALPIQRILGSAQAVTDWLRARVPS